MKFHWLHRRLWPHLHYGWYVGKHLDPCWANAPGYNSERTMRASGATMQAPPSPEPSFDQQIERGTLIAGSADSVTEQTEDLIRRTRVGYLIGVFQFGDMAHDLVTRNTRLFAEQVIPRLRNLWNDYKDHWSPRPLKAVAGTDLARTEANSAEHSRTLELAGVN